jgi:hypothetical protein
LLALKSCKGKCQKLNVRLVRLRILQSQLRRALLAAAAAKVDELSTAVKACNGFKGNEHCDLMRANLKRAQVHLQRTQTAHRASVAARLAESKIAKLRDQVKVCLTQDQCMRVCSLFFDVLHFHRAQNPLVVIFFSAASLAFHCSGRLLQGSRCR